MRTRTFVLLGVLAALLVAGVASYFASSSPDGLEHVAEQAGFAEKAKDSAASGSPLADYEVTGVEHDALSGGLAGVTGALVVLALAGGLTFAVRRTSRPDRERSEQPADRDRD
ncbi:MAG TPA: PDGLE domain-containing protein [Nocardioidaceae bacterium]|nr:PDGLE domain-containing protein [Nocardioidaceae bacterium]